MPVEPGERAVTGNQPIIASLPSESDVVGDPYRGPWKPHIEERESFSPTPENISNLPRISQLGSDKVGI